MKMDKILKQAQRMQAQMSLAQQELDSARIIGVAGGGAVNATVTGTGDIISIKLAKEAVDLEDLEMLEDLLVVAIKDAQEKAKQESEKKMNAVSGGLNAFGGAFGGLF
ncbi:MAG: YbaB/EbfC family nucleoid-associated protein [Synergistaceae bacterium]|nr:YbaB/EbfC family nucleoid-associated protein [Synergistaceae bacterium]